MSVDATASRPAPMVEGWLPVDALADVVRHRRGQGRRARLPAAGERVAGREGLRGRRGAPGAGRAATGATGTGVAVGVTSDSINRVGAGVAGSQGDRRPARDVEVVADATTGGTDEGRATAATIYYVAPGMSKLVSRRRTAARR